ncbi:MAG: TonB-dependent receptor [Gammaproteobacteria bacterium]|nr:TonB-dependent receptor [Gammaproteobacteria bacterium]
MLRRLIASLLRLLVLIGVGFSFPLYAENGEEASSAQIEEVIVTGSRILRDPMTVHDAIVNFDVSDRDRTGLTSLSDMFARLSISGSTLNTRFNSSGNFGFPADGGGVAAGAAHVDLRHLGAKRVLVLVDGVRWIHGSSGSGVSGATDLNTIPASIVDHIEVLRDGASAVYGSDAIAGVVNVITRSVDGFSAAVYTGRYVNGGDTVDFETSFGHVSDSTSASLNFTFTDQDRISASNHEQTRWPKPGTGVTHGSTYTPQGRVIFTDPNTGSFVNCALNEGVVGLPVYDAQDPCGPNDDYHPWTNADRFNYAPFNLVLTPSKRKGLFGRVEHEISPTVRVHARVLLHERTSINQGAPEPVWAGDLSETGSVLDDIVINAVNPFNPFGFDLGSGTFATRRLLESGPRVFQQDVQTRYSTLGARGTLTGWRHPLYWDANLVWSVNSADQTKHGAHNARNMLYALGSPNACRAINGCTPLNLLGGQATGGSITDEMLDWIGFVQRDSSSQKLRGISLNVTGDVADLAGGAVALAMGIEKRYHEGRFDPDPVVTAGETAGLPAQPTFGEFDVSELYAEIELPIIELLPAAELIEISAATRYFDYSTFDSGTTSKIGIRWQLKRGLLMRGTWSEGFRAPNIGELFGGQTRLDAVIADPCSDFLVSNIGPEVIQNCVAAGVPVDGTYAQLGSQISVMTGGNPSLRPESSDGVTLAAIWQPDLLDGSMSIQLVRYRHDINDVITGYDAQTVLDGCYRNNVVPLCDLIQRNERGGISQFRNTIFNTGSIRTRGWDFEFTWTDGGPWQIDWQVTHLDEFTELLRDSSNTVIEVRELAGLTEADRGKPEWKSSLSFSWRRDRWEMSWTSRYIHAMTERCSDFLDGSPDSLTNLGLCSNPNYENNSRSRNRLATTIYHDLQARHTFAVTNRDVGVTVGIVNLFDRDPPVSQSATLNGYDASVYDVPGGRFVYAKITYRPQ